MKHPIFPIYLIAIGVITFIGVDLFGSAILEGAAWKQNVILALLIIFGMLPPVIREMKATWMIAGYALAFFMFGGANLIGTVGMMLGLEKIMLAVLMLYLCYRVWAETWKINKLFIIAPLVGLLSIGLLSPIEDQNIIGSGLEALMSWSTEKFTSDKGFHIYLGLAGITAGISELLICRQSMKVPQNNEVSKGLVNE